MKKLSILLSIIVSIASCAHPDKALKETINNSDSVYVQYFSSNNDVAKIKTIKDKKKITLLTDLITASIVGGRSKCGYDGSIHFFKHNNVVQDIYFKMNDDNCRQFTFIQNNIPAATNLSEEAKKLLEELQK